MKYNDINPNQFINMLQKYFDSKYISTWERRFKKNNIYIDSAVKEIYKSKGIDLRKDILNYRIDNNLLSNKEAYNSEYNINKSRVINGKTKWD